MTGKKRLLLLLLVLNGSTTISTLLYSSSANTLPRSEGYLFTFAHITDSQFSGSSLIFENTTTWLAQQENLSFVVHTGDIVDNPLDETAWKNAYKYMHQLDNRSKWAVIAGDNDIVSRNRADLTNYMKYLGPNSIDHYHVIKDKLLFILLSWNNTDGSISKERLEWMDQIIQTHKELKVVVCIHPYLLGIPLLNIMRLPNEEEIWTHINKHKNIIMILSGHTHQNWIRILSGVWSISTQALNAEGYIRLFNVYKDRIEAYAHSPWTNKTYTGPLDQFTIRLNPENQDSDSDLWNNELDIMPTHPIIPNGILISLTATIAVLAYWIKERSK